MHDVNALLARVESSQLWAYFHKDWLLQIRSQIRPQLPKAYSIFVESEAILVAPAVEGPPIPVAPDISVTRPERLSEPSASAPQGTAAVIEVEEPCELVTAYTLLIRRAPENRLIALRNCFRYRIRAYTAYGTATASCASDINTWSRA